MKFLLIGLILFASSGTYASNYMLNCRNNVGAWDTDPNGIDNIKFNVNPGCKEFDITCINKLEVDLYSKTYTLSWIGSSVHINTILSFSSNDKKFLADLIIDLIPKYATPSDDTAPQFDGKSFKALLILKQYYANFPFSEVINLKCNLE